MWIIIKKKIEKCYENLNMKHTGVERKEIRMRTIGKWITRVSLKV